jgi:hypothetical protein
MARPVLSEAQFHCGWKCEAARPAELHLKVVLRLDPQWRLRSPDASVRLRANLVPIAYSSPRSKR